jgi:pimeloyl-ACP methyl ester carboxylesterase
MITHIKNPYSDKCIVFVHGLGGGIGTFRKFCEYLERKWNLSFGIKLLYFTFYKMFFSKNIPLLFNVFTLYSVQFLLFIFKASWSKRNQYNAILLKNYINKNCIQYNNIIIVAHSMGGLIARQYLVNCKKEKTDIRNIRMLFTFATPHNGSHIAKGISLIPKIPSFNKLYITISEKLNYRISPQIGDLSNLNKFIIQLNQDWRDFNVERDLQFIRIGGNKDWLVRTNSSNLHNDDLNNLYYFDYGHSGLICPSKKNELFAPIDKFIEKLNFLEIREEYFEELDEEIDYDMEPNIEDY